MERSEAQGAAVAGLELEPERRIWVEKPVSLPLPSAELKKQWIKFL